MTVLLYINIQISNNKQHQQDTFCIVKAMMSSGVHAGSDLPLTPDVNGHRHTHQDPPLDLIHNDH